MTYQPGIQSPDEKDLDDGYVGLDAGGKVPVSKLRVFGASGAGHSAGILPDPGELDDGLQRGIREDAVWAVLPYDVIRTEVMDQNATTGTIDYELGRLFQVTGQLLISTGGTSGNIVVSITWTDPTNTEQTATLLSQSILSPILAIPISGVFATKDPGLGSFSWTLSFTGTKGPLVASWFIGVRVVSSS